MNYLWSIQSAQLKCLSVTSYLLRKFHSVYITVIKPFKMYITGLEIQACVSTM